jgi:glycosyltransferase involved in cell wall biosynthesis
MTRILSIVWVFCFSLKGFCEPHASKKTICLNMIVKNEREVITRCLESVIPIIDTWVIVDTGSDDGTQMIIQEFMQKKNIPGQLYERSWVNFGYNRNEALSLAKDQADYILFMDADDILSFSQDFVLPDLKEAFYATTSYNGEKECTLPRLVKASLPWKWEGVIHEYLGVQVGASGVMFEGVDYIYHHDGARAKDPSTLLKDLELLESDPTPRNLFYAMLSYEQLGKWAEGLAVCKKRLEMGGLAEEIFIAQLTKGKLENLLKKDSKLVKESFFKAYLLRPHRLEPLYYLGKKLWEEESYSKGYELLHLAMQLPRQEEDVLFVETWIYDFGFLAEYMRFAAATGHYKEGLDAAEKILSLKDVFASETKSAKECQRYIQQQVVREIQEKLQYHLSTLGR